MTLEEALSRIEDLGRYAAMRDEQRDATLTLHSRIGSGFSDLDTTCEQDGFTYPCPTVRALGAE